MYTRMLRIRLFDERAGELAAAGAFPGSVHLSIGEEATCVGACLAMRPGDYMTGNHRSHGHPIANGSDIKLLMAELFGKATGVCKGKGGSMHLADFAIGSLGESGIVASALPVAVGSALSAQVRGSGQVCIAFFGDGGINEGVFHEAVNLAGAWKLGVVFLCENNYYSVDTLTSTQTAGSGIANRASAYGIPGKVVDGQDVLAVYAVVKEAVARAGSGQGPSLIEAQTYRYREHAQGMRIKKYRSDEEEQRWLARDPIQLFAAKLLADEHATVEELDAVRARLTAEVANAVEFGKSSPFPSVEEALLDNYAPTTGAAGIR
jgi:pyruvate dehydrogenase E1 component alpha subunit